MSFLAQTMIWRSVRSGSKARNLIGKVKLIGFDALPEALGQIKAGNMTASIEQLPGGQVRGAMEALVPFLRMAKSPLSRSRFLLRSPSQATTLIRPSV